MTIPKAHSRWYWFFRCILCERLRWPGMYRICERPGCRQPALKEPKS